jgi:hypothetical protein
MKRFAILLVAVVLLGGCGSGGDGGSSPGGTQTETSENGGYGY